jgi:GT2 family glycosyltransferase
MRTAIYSLTRRHELPRTMCFLAQAMPVLSPQRRLHILINDQDSPELRQYVASRSEHVVIHCLGHNLGVAGGRNFLIRNAIAEGAEFLISCDNDIVYDAEYFERLESAYLRLSATDPSLGLLQGLLLDGRQVRSVFPQLATSRDWQQVLDRVDTAAAWRRGLWPHVVDSIGIERAIDTVYHSGVANPWPGHFGSPPAGIGVPYDQHVWIATFGTDLPTTRSEPGFLKRLILAARPARIATAAGGITAFGAKAFEELGGYNEAFNPFGYEDSEFGFRALFAGRHNYLVPDAVGIHDIFLGASNRSLMSGSRIGLLRGVEATSPALGEPATEHIVRQSLVYAWRDLLKPLGDALESGQLDAADPGRVCAELLASYLFDFCRGAIGELSKSERIGAASGALRLLAAWAGSNNLTLDRFELPLGLGAFLVAGKVVSRRRQADDGKPTFSLYGTNLRVEERQSAATLASRYFDLSLSVAAQADRWVLTVDVLSDDHLFAVRCVARPRTAEAISAGSVEILEWCVRHHQHEYGRFSAEDLYPAPTLHAATNWLPAALAYLDRLDSAARMPAVSAATHALRRYLQLGSPQLNTGVRLAAGNDVGRRKKILLFADSRGQHKPAGQDHPLFGERLAADPRLEVELVLCPMKWTTTLDFLATYSAEQLQGYDHVILYTGIVDWSPRRLSNAVSEVYHHEAPINAGNLRLNTRDYSKKIINDKKQAFDGVFGPQAMASHFARPLSTRYEGEPTINMYGLEMARRSLLPRLDAIPNLIFVTANRFVSGWRGDYPRERPANIDITHAYSDLFSEGLARAKVIDLRQWSDAEVRVYTCDNLHLTQRGSDWIHDRLLEAMGLTDSAPGSAARTPAPSPPAVHGLSTPERITPDKKSALLAKLERTGRLATLIIGVRLHPSDAERNENLRALLGWIDHFYGDLFDVLIVEQDREPRVNLAAIGVRPYVRHEFLYNPREYNRGWGYNVAIARFCADAQVVALMDTDVLTGANFVREVIECHGGYDAISPYRNIYYTNAKEAKEVLRTRRLEGLHDPRRIKNPVTVAGGILIIKRSVFLGLKGFEQYVGYGCEDRALDVTLYNHIAHSRIRTADAVYAHLWHRSDANSRLRFEEIYAHLTANYGCDYDPDLGPADFIHKNCRHADMATTQRLMERRAKGFGDPMLYRRMGNMSVNGIVETAKVTPMSQDIVYPPELTSLADYPARELYADAADPDESEIAALYNKFRGQRCFIIGNGPSLNRHDLSLLEGEYTFGVNSFFYKTRETGFRPYFYVVEDSSVMKENIEEIRRFEAPYKFFPTNYRKLHPKTPNTLFFRMNRGFYEKSSPNYVVPRFSTDASKVLYCGQSVTYINLQLAYFLGFSEVYLIGMDFSYVIPASHKRSGDVLLSDSDDPNHFHKDYFGKGKTWKDPKLDRVAMNYRLAKLTFESTGRTVRNATIGGSLEIFERVDYEELMRGPIADRSGMTSALAAANEHYRARRYAAALAGYVALAQNDGRHFPYKRYAVDAFLRASEAHQSCAPGDAAFVRGLICNI